MADTVTAPCGHGCGRQIHVGKTAIGKWCKWCMEAARERSESWEEYREAYAIGHGFTPTTAYYERPSFRSRSEGGSGKSTKERVEYERSAWLSMLTLLPRNEAEQLRTEVRAAFEATL